MATVHEPVSEVDGSIPEHHFVLHVKGSPEALFKLCSEQSTNGTPMDVEPFNKDQNDHNVKAWPESSRFLSWRSSQIIYY